MKALALVVALAALASGAKWWLEAHNLFEAYDPAVDEHVRTALGHEIHSFLKRLSRTLLALAVFTLVDLLWLPWLRIGDVATGEDGWHGVAPAVRAAVVGGWFAALAAFLLSFSLGI